MCSQCPTGQWGFVPLTALPESSHLGQLLACPDTGLRVCDPLVRDIEPWLLSSGMHSAALTLFSFVGLCSNRLKQEDLIPPWPSHFMRFCVGRARTYHLILLEPNAELSSFGKHFVAPSNRLPWRACQLLQGFIT